MLYNSVYNVNRNKQQEGGRNMKESIGRKILERRKELNMSQETLSEKSKVCRATISSLENGKCSNVLIETLNAIATALETTVDSFLT